MELSSSGFWELAWLLDDLEIQLWRTVPQSGAAVMKEPPGCDQERKSHTGTSLH